MPKVFILDDDRIVSHSLSQILMKSGFDVCVYQSSEECLEKCNEFPDGYLLLDQKMPGMTGIEVQHSLKQMNCPLKIIFITATADAIYNTAINEGALAVLEKPFDPKVLIGILENDISHR